MEVIVIQKISLMTHFYERKGGVFYQKKVEIERKFAL
jgi:hypothetical protein